MAIKPNSTPKATLQEVMRLVKNPPANKCYLVGVRGYYSDTFGKPGVNDRGVYDDAMFIVSPDAFISYNANVDPGAYREGIANLKKGVWQYKIGIHGLSKPKHLQYKALVQAGEVTVARDDEGDDTGYFGINIHKGGLGAVNSLGCQTIYPDQWMSFISTVESMMKKYSQKTLEYHLV
jgi:lysozyme